MIRGVFFLYLSVVFIHNCLGLLNTTQWWFRWQKMVPDWLWGRLENLNLNMTFCYHISIKSAFFIVTKPKKWQRWTVEAWHFVITSKSNLHIALVQSLRNDKDEQSKHDNLWSHLNQIFIFHWYKAQKLTKINSQNTTICYHI